MAIVLRIKRDELVDGAMELPYPPQGTIRGIVRLWYEKPGEVGVAMTRSNKSLVIGDDIGPISGPTAQRYGESIRSGDVQRIGGWEKLLTDRGLSLDDYVNNRSFTADLALPASIIDAYVG